VLALGRPERLQRRVVDAPLGQVLEERLPLHLVLVGGLLDVALALDEHGDEGTGRGQDGQQVVQVHERPPRCVVWRVGGVCWRHGGRTRLWSPDRRGRTRPSAAACPQRAAPGEDTRAMTLPPRSDRLPSMLTPFDVDCGREVFPGHQLVLRGLTDHGRSRDDLTGRDRSGTSSARWWRWRTSSCQG
jgi:hypothetical protein